MVGTALVKRRRLRIVHYVRSRNETIEREVSPQRLVHYRDNWYLDAWCHSRKDIRSFALDAIGDAEIIDKPSRDVSTRQLDTTLGAGYGIFSGAAIEWAQLRFTAERARWVAAEQWHPQQKARYDADGRYHLEIPYANPTELVMDILRHGGAVEVLGPQSLRAAIKNELAAMTNMYS
jgi:predicted DNA-binding transcriptional regulator YafY